MTRRFSPRANALATYASNEYQHRNEATPPAPVQPVMKFLHGFGASVLPNLFAGLTSGLVTLVYAVSFAALIFSEKLSPHFPEGAGAALIGAAITAIIVAWRSPFPFTVAGPEANSAIILALAGRSIANALDASGRSASIYPTVWAAIILSSVTTGLFLYLLGRFRLGHFARYVPYPVMGGFLAGTGWLITRSSFKVMTGVPLGIAELPRLAQPEVAAQWIAGIGVAAILFLGLARLKNVLALAGLLLGGVVLGNIAWMVLKSTSMHPNLEAWFFQPFPREGIWQAWDYSTLGQIDWTVLYHQSGTLLAMIPIVVLSILLNATGLELATSRHVDLNEELRADGLANLVNGACGGILGYLSINRCLLNQRAGATSPVAGMIAGGFCGGVLVFGSSFLSFIPKPLLGGLLLYIGATLLVRWVYKTWSQLPRFDYVLVLFILVIVVTVGFIAGIGSGILIACILFIVSYGKTSSIKYSLSGRTSHSNVVRSAPQQQLLQREGDSIAILVLHGFVFFGTANHLLDGVRQRLAEQNRNTLKYVLFDFRLVPDLDSSAVLSFLKLGQVAEKAALHLIFTHLAPTIEEQLRRGGLSFTAHSRVHSLPDLDHGIEWCENEILRSHHLLETPAAPLVAQVRAVLDNKELASQLLAYMRPIELAKDETLFQQGEPSNGLYFLEAGRVSVVVTLPNGTNWRRRTFTEGTILGEMGFYSGEQRSATVIADEASRLHYLSKEAFQQIEAEAPLLASSFNKGIINLLAERLRRSEEEGKMLLQ